MDGCLPGVRVGNTLVDRSGGPNRDGGVWKGWLTWPSCGPGSWGKGPWVTQPETPHFARLLKS